MLLSLYYSDDYFSLLINYVSLSLPPKLFSFIPFFYLFVLSLVCFFKIVFDYLFAGFIILCLLIYLLIY